LIKEAIATGATVEEACEAASEALLQNENVVKYVGDVATADIQYEIIDTPSKKILGLFGGSPAKVRAYIEIEEPKKAKKPVKDNAKKQNKKADKKEQKEVKEVKTEEVPAEKVFVEITDETEKNVVESGKEFLGNVLKLMNVDATLSAGKTESGLEILIEGKDLGVVVGRRGETLDALQYLTILAANRKESGYNRITLNTGNYREKRNATLNALAERMANLALRQGRNVTLEPMNPYERRIIHTAVQNIKGVTSWSVGEEPNRRVVIGSGKDKGGYNRGGQRGRGGRRPTPAQNTTPAVDREQKKDFGSAPLYGKIERKIPEAE